MPPRAGAVQGKTYAPSARGLEAGDVKTEMENPGAGATASGADRNKAELLHSTWPSPAQPDAIIQARLDWSYQAWNRYDTANEVFGRARSVALAAMGIAFHRKVDENGHPESPERSDGNVIAPLRQLSLGKITNRTMKRLLRQMAEAGHLIIHRPGRGSKPWHVQMILKPETYWRVMLHEIDIEGFFEAKLVSMKLVDHFRAAQSDTVTLGDKDLDIDGGGGDPALLPDALLFLIEAGALVVSSPDGDGRKTYRRVVPSRWLGEGEE